MLSVNADKKRTLRYSDTLRHDFKLLQIEPEMVAELENGRVAFKGLPNDPGHHAEAVLCTSKSTYEVREVETTNLVMLIDEPGAAEGDGSRDGASVGSAVSVTALVKAHLELKLINPKLDMLDKALKEDHVITDIVSLDGDGDARGRHQLPKGETWESLRDKVQASDAEISKALEDLDAVRIDGGWMGVSPESYSSFVKLVLLTLTERGWQLERVPCVEMALALEEHGVCGQVTLQLLRKLQVDGSGNINSVEEDDRRDWRELPSPPGPYALDLRAVCRHVAIGMLLEQEAWEDAEEFLASWKAALPDTVVPTMDMVQGECIELETEVLGDMGAKTVRRSVRRLSVGDLPRDVSRFEQLFTIKSAWKLEEILPFIRGLAAPGQNTEELLLKHARPSQTRPDDPVLYTKR